MKALLNEEMKTMRDPLVDKQVQESLAAKNKRKKKKKH